MPLVFPVLLTLVLVLVSHSAENVPVKEVSKNQRGADLTAPLASPCCRPPRFGALTLWISKLRNYSFCEPGVLLLPPPTAHLLLRRRRRPLVVVIASISMCCPLSSSGSDR